MLMSVNNEYGITILSCIRGENLEEFGSIYSNLERGHSLTIDSGWREVADSVLGWLGEHDLPWQHVPAEP